MANARKLPSGAYQTRVTKVINGKKVTKCFTVHPKDCKGDSRKAKQQSELLARQWQIETENKDTYGKNVKECLDEYIKGRRKVLSPRTIYDYELILEHLKPLWDICMDDIKSSDVQALINEWSVSVSCKTIINRTSLLLSALDYCDCDRKFKLRYPQKNPKKVLSPDIEDVQMLLANAPEELKPCIALAAFGSLRRGEISALKEMDISRDMNTVTVHADVVLTSEGFTYKPTPKTSGSFRTVDLPKFVIDMLPVHEDPDAYVFDLNPGMITKRFYNLKNQLGLDCTFHSLRHYAASFRSDLKIPQKYIEEVGGWKNESSVLKNVYDNTLKSSRKKYTMLANKYIEDNFEEIVKRKAN